MMIQEKEVGKRAFWINEIRSLLNGDFTTESKILEEKIDQEINKEGLDTLIGHLRFCGVIPEEFSHDTSEEKLYSKYTDILIHEAYKFMGFESEVLKERAGVADVECSCDEYDFVADAKAFRLSRTAKNQKDFKIKAMQSWKKNKDYAMLVAPIYQLLVKQSQIYQQSAETSVLISSYSHLVVLVRYADLFGKKASRDLLHNVFKTLTDMSPSKNSKEYWKIINNSFLSFDENIRTLWDEERKATLEVINISRKNSLRFIESEKAKIRDFSREEAIKEVLSLRKFENKIGEINKDKYIGLFMMGDDDEQ